MTIKGGCSELEKAGELRRKAIKSLEIDAKPNKTSINLRVHLEHAVSGRG